MTTIPLKGLTPGSYYSSSVFIDQGYIVLSPETPVTSQLVKRLITWEFRELFSESEDVKVATEAPDEKPAKSDEDATPEGEAAAIDAGENEDRVKAFYDKLALYVESLYTRYVTRNEMDKAGLTDNVKVLADVVAKNRRQILKVMQTTALSQNYLIQHSVRSTVLALVLGSFLKLPPHRLIELGVATVLHEIGMVKLPPQLYMAQRQLTDVERKSITTHPILSYNILKEKEFPLAICLAALEHHERLNGSGYPRALQADKISLYARIIMVACSYDAVTASRPYKEAKDGYSGMLDILKNAGKQYDETVIKALVFSMSIFPIGTFVLLSNGKKALVLDVGAANPRFPIVQVVGERHPSGKHQVVATSENGVRVLRPLNKAEADEARAVMRAAQNP
jgi:HD-GYP domain-containing protein (c-di-GMP phosphodiesterase class II)